MPTSKNFMKFYNTSSQATPPQNNIFHLPTSTMSGDDGLPAKVAIGISFGNSYSSIAHTSREGKAEVIANEDGDRQIPSMLSYVSGEEFQGAQAKAQLIRNPKNTVAYFRDFLGQE